MSEHTIEPWRVAEESFDNDGIHESVIRGLDGRAAITCAWSDARAAGISDARARQRMARDSEARAMGKEINHG